VIPSGRPRYRDEVARGLRQPARAVATTVTSGERRDGSWWVNLSRPALSAVAQAKATGMSRSAIGRTVRGAINEP